MKEAVPANVGGMEERVEVSGEALTDPAGVPSLLGSYHGHINQDGSADDILPRHTADEAAVVRILTVVAHHEVAILRNLVGHGNVRGVRALGAPQSVIFLEFLAVDPDGAVVDIDGVAGKADDAFDPVRRVARNRRTEDDHLLATLIAPKGQVQVRKGDASVVADTAHDDVVADEQRVFHGSGRNDARLTYGAVDKQKREDYPEP